MQDPRRGGGRWGDDTKDVDVFRLGGDGGEGEEREDRREGERRRLDGMQGEDLVHVRVRRKCAACDIVS